MGCSLVAEDFPRGAVCSAHLFFGGVVVRGFRQGRRDLRGSRSGGALPSVDVLVILWRGFGFCAAGRRGYKLAALGGCALAGNADALLVFGLAFVLLAFLPLVGRFEHSSVVILGSFFFPRAKLGAFGLGVVAALVGVPGAVLLKLGIGRVLLASLLMLSGAVLADQFGGGAVADGRAVYPNAHDAERVGRRGLHSLYR